MRGPAENSDIKLLRLAVDLSPAGKIAVAEDGTILLVNREIERMFGYAREELLGQSIDLLVPQDMRSGHPSFRAKYLASPSARPMGSGRELFGLRKDGVKVPVEIGLNPVPLDGTPVVLASVVDISARTRAEARFAAAVEASPSGMIMTDEQGMITLVNREVEQLFGYSRAELIGTPIERLVPQRMRSQHPAHRSAFFANAQKRAMGAGRELFGVRKDGTEIALEIALNPIATDEGKCVLCSLVDVTSRRQLEAHLRQSHKLEAIGTLASGVAHDFNNILLAIIGHVELVQAVIGDDAEINADLQQVLVAADRGRQLVKRILTFSRQDEVHRAPLQLERTVREVMHLLRASLPTTIEMRESLHADAPQVLADETQVHQVLMNLATNAAHAMPGGGTLELRLEPAVIKAGQHHRHLGLQPGLYVRMSVIDSGAGMNDETRKRAFDPFFTTKGPGEGTGLGLAVVHGIVEAHRGAIELDSKPGDGTRVHVYLPAYTAKVEAESSAESEEGRPHVMLVEDERAILNMLRRQLDLLGCRVTAHTSSIEALQIVLTKPTGFDLLITDNTMPHLTGLELAQRVREAAPALPILLISGLVQRADPGLLRAAGVTELLGKPHTFAELRVVVERLLGDRIAATVKS